MNLSASRAIVLVLAILAGWIVVGDAAFAVPTSKAHCHSASLTEGSESQVSTGRLSPDERAATDIGRRHDGDTRGHDGCPTGGVCCDAMCHAVLIGAEPTTDAVVVTFASYPSVSEAPVVSPVVSGLDRPPRSISL